MKLFFIGRMTADATCVVKVMKRLGAAEPSNSLSPARLRGDTPPRNAAPSAARRMLTVHRGLRQVQPAAMIGESK